MADLDASSDVCTNLREKNEELRREITGLIAQKAQADGKCQELAVRIGECTEQVSAIQENYEKQLQAVQALSASGEKELQGQMQSLREQVNCTKVGPNLKPSYTPCLIRYLFQHALAESEADVQQMSREKDAAVDKTNEVNGLLKKLRIDYEKSLAEVSRIPRIHA